MGILSFSGVKRPEHGADDPLISVAELANWLELYLRLPLVPAYTSWDDLYLTFITPRLLPSVHIQLLQSFYLSKLYII
jgi:hypothetical protein